jgi:(1->4)-alpha-D-glucan 1-alpha-D-glucosylmutase
VLRDLKGCAKALPHLATQLLEQRADGRVKMFVMMRALEARARLRPVYERGDFIPLSAHGRWRDHVFAFARRHGDDVAITCVPRLVASLANDDGGLPIGTIWDDTRLDVSPVLSDSTAGALRHVFTDALLETDAARTIPLATLFERFPVALLVDERSRPSRA